jgi:hypothetical protein
LVILDEFQRYRDLPSKESRRDRLIATPLALYRLTFGQPRQEKLLEFLKRHSPERAEATAMEQHIDLRPPITS